MKEPKSEDLEYLLMTIRQLHFEGIADLIDMKDIIKSKAISESEDWYAYHFNSFFNDAKSTLQEVDNLLVKNSKSKSSELGHAIWELLHFGTHPEALHMALLIEDTFGKNHIISILDNSFKIFRSYQKAAIKNPNKGHVFSDKSITYLKELESQYLIHIE